MEKEINLRFNFYGQFRVFLQELLPLLQGNVDADFGLTLDDFRRWKLFLLMPLQRRRYFLPSCVFWLQWFFYDIFGFSFYTVRRLHAETTPFLVLGCVALWRGLFAYIGNRGLVGWRRVALKGFLTKQRFVTRYNYRRLTHYFWRRFQRRWRLFRTRRRPFFFLRRYRKLRRLRYYLALNFSWRATRSISRLGTRWGALRTRIFARELLRWRAYVISSKLRYGALYRLHFFRLYPHFRSYRYQARYRAVKAQGSLGYITPSIRLWTRRTRAGVLVGTRLFVDRGFRKSLDAATYPDYKKRLRRRRILRRRRLWWRMEVKGRRSSRHVLSLARLPILRRLLRRRPKPKSLRLKGGRRLAVRRRRRRWYRPKAWRRRRRRSRFLWVTLRPLVRARRRFKRHFKYRRFLKRFKRRIKRRVKRRRKYRRRWLRTSILSCLRRRTCGLHGSLPVNKKRRRLVIQPRSIHLFEGLAPQAGKFRFISAAHVFPLLAVKTLQSGWRQGVDLQTRYSETLQYQRGTRAYHARWREGEAPAYLRLRHYRRQRQLGRFGRYRRWLCALFINGRRQFFYKERTLPIVRTLVPRQLFLPTEVVADNLQIVHSVGVGIKTSRSLAYRKRFFRRIRQATRKRFSLRKRRRFSRRRWQKRALRRLQRCRLRRKKYFYRRHKKCRKRFRMSSLCRMRRTLFRRLRRKLIGRRLYGRTRILTYYWAKSGKRWWRTQAVAVRKYADSSLSRRQTEDILWRYSKQRFFFRLRFLQRVRSITHTRLAQFEAAFLFQQGLKIQAIQSIRARGIRRFSGLVRQRFRHKFIGHLQSRLKAVVLFGGTLGVKNILQTPFLLMSEKAEHFMIRVRRLARRSAVFGLVASSFVRQRSFAYRASRYIIRRGLGLFKAHALLTRRYPSVYDFETFDYLFSSEFLYTRFATKGSRLRSQLIVMSVLRYLRPYSSFHLVRFIERFLVEGFPIYFEMSSLKQSNKEQPFPVPINLTFFRNYMLKAIATRFRAKRQVVSFQAALLTELWSWHVDPTQSILHDFLVNHYAVGLDSRFFVHYRWRVKR